MTAREIASAITLLCCLALTTVIYWPALTGPFLFDDIRNLEDLGAAGGVTDWPSFALWVFGGTAGPFGRPVALASFLINDFTWPTDPWSFKYTNLMLHLVTGLLVFWFLDQFAQRLPTTDRGVRGGRVAAVIAAGLWLVHPIQIATVMFVVQRMTILCTAFMLAGMVAWLKGAQLSKNRPIAGGFLMAGALGFFGALALLCKETAVLLPCYVAVVASAIPAIDMESPRLRRLHWGILLVPTSAAIVYLIISHADLRAAFAIREFTPAQRVMTEPLVLWSYVRELIAPDLRVGLYYDDLKAVSTLLDPAAVIAMLAWIAAIALAVRWRKSQPVATFAILWFVIGHSLEAGPFSLELKFLHRNYLPSVGPMFAAVYYLLRLEPAALGRVLGVALVAVDLAIAAVNATTWGDEGLLVNTWATQQPGSQRAQQAAASYWLRHHDLQKSLSYLDRAVAADPASPALRIQSFYLRCINSQPVLQSWASVLDALPNGDLDTATSESLQLLSAQIADGNCPELRQADVRQAADRLLANPRYRSPKWQRALEVVQGQSYVFDLDLNGAMTHFDRAYAALPTAYTARVQAAILASAGLYADAIRYLERERDTPPTNLGERIYFDARLRPVVDAEIEALRQRLPNDKR